MTMYTITEAFAELKVLPKRIAKQREAITTYLARPAALRDPFEKEGKTSAQFVAETLQSIGDLENRIISIRAAIAQANLKNTISIPNHPVRTITDWLTFRRGCV